MNKVFKILATVALFLVVYKVNAQGGPPPPPDGGGGPGGVDDIPIDFFVVPFLLFGSLLGYYLLKKVALK
ncbi:hypothetical protein [Flavobacteriaceae bacterium 14752]|uniref:hypothetical protein n=1 Tax=Mesohalobacter salilacus TaxID=2491711 RepID=UPI000F63CF7D|nr:hypothetical protein EIG84_05730 [Flavobacteriaceae bacterium 14752]